jgi:hypothetical protein
MKRSATPLHSGSPTYDGEIVHPSHFTSLIQASAMYWGPPVAPDRRAPRHLFAEPPEGMANPLANGLDGGPAIVELCGVPADHFAEMVIDRAEEPAPAVPLGIEACRQPRAHLPIAEGPWRPGGAGTTGTALTNALLRDSAVGRGGPLWIVEATADVRVPADLLNFPGSLALN